MTRLEQRGAVAFTGAAVADGGDPANHAVGISVLANGLGRASLARVFDQTKLRVLRSRHVISCLR